MIAFDSSNLLLRNFYSIHLVTPLLKVTQSSVLKRSQVSDCWLSPFDCRRKTKARWEHTHVSLLVEPLSFVLLWLWAQATAFWGIFKCITWATPVTSRGTPSEVSIFSQRQRMVITSRDILRRQAGGGSSRGKTVSWTKTVKNVSNQGQEEEGEERRGKTQPNLMRCWF